MEEKVVYSVIEVAKILGCDVKTIRKEIVEGNIPSLDLKARVYRIPGWWIRQQREGLTVGKSS